MRSVPPGARLASAGLVGHLVSDPTIGRLTSEVQIDPAIRAVEVKVTARIEDEQRVLALLRRSGEEPSLRSVWFFDTPDLALYDAGVILRARKMRDDDDDATVKLRPVDPARIPGEWMQVESFEIELDRVGERQIVSAKLSAVQTPGEIDEAVSGRRPLRKLFTQEQERLIRTFAPAEVKWANLVAMGPIDVQKWRVEFTGFTREVVAERWMLPDRSDLVELSIRIAPGEAAAAAAEFGAFLASRGLDIEGDHQVKTRGALRFFTAGIGFS